MLPEVKDRKYPRIPLLPIRIGPPYGAEIRLKCYPGLNHAQVGQWKREIQAQAKSLFEGKRGPEPVSPESAPDRLYGEIGRLKMELDWLKKKSGISLP